MLTSQRIELISEEEANVGTGVNKLTAKMQVILFDIVLKDGHLIWCFGEIDMNADNCNNFVVKKIPFDGNKS